MNGLLPGSKVIDDGNEPIVAAKAGKGEADFDPPSPAKAPEKDLSCKKYIASAGLTVSVPCED